MNITIVHNAVNEKSAPDDMDILHQVDAVSEALSDLGHDVLVLPCTLDLDGIKDRLETIRPDIVFNLVESLEGQGRLIHLFPSLLDAMQIPYTGASALAILLSSNKILAKAQMEKKKLRTPPFIGPIPPCGSVDAGNGGNEDPYQKKWLVKSVWEHASIGLDEDTTLENKSREEILSSLGKRVCTSGGDWFAEAYIDGREFNISLLAGENGPEVLPPAEIIFEGYADEKLKIVGYKAKWDPSSYEYQHTPRRFDFPITDGPLISELENLSRQCWDIFGLSGYARLDFRVDAHNRPFILEVNTNPCLSPDAGFAAAVSRKGLSFTQAITRILMDPISRVSSGIKRGHITVRQESPQPPVKNSNPFCFRYEVMPCDIDIVGQMTRKTGFFREDEVDIAMELVEERLKHGDKSGYHFIFAEKEGAVLGYACFGPIACTVSSHDLFWIVVYPEYQKTGVGKALIDEVEKQVLKMGGTRIYVETSHREDYYSTRIFYERCGYGLASILEDFYASGDAKATYCKALIA